MCFTAKCKYEDIFGECTLGTKRNRPSFGEYNCFFEIEKKEEEKIEEPLRKANKDNE